jgi:glycosyltransferase involved in cell wall biosynthesis
MTEAHLRCVVLGDRSQPRTRQLLTALQRLPFDVELRELGSSTSLARMVRRVARTRCLDRVLLVTGNQRYSSLLLSIIARCRGWFVLVDAFIPWHEKWVAERRRFRPGSPRALELRAREMLRCWAGSVTVTDTPEHGAYLARFAFRSRSRFVTIRPASFVVEERRERGREKLDVGINTQAPMVVGFMGGGQRFHGVSVIVDAARILETRKRLVRFSVVLDPEAYQYVSRSTFPSLVHVSDALPPDQAAAWLDSVGVILGTFGESEKFDRVVPYKVVDGLAAGRPVITGRSSAVKSAMADHAGIILVPPNSPSALADAIDSLLDANIRSRTAAAAHQLYEQSFSLDATRRHLGQLLGEWGF